MNFPHQMAESGSPVPDRPEPTFTQNQALDVLRRAYAQVRDAMLIYSASGELAYANEPALRALHIASIDEHPPLRSAMVAFDADGRRLEQAEWPIFRALRGETVIDCELTVTMPTASSGTIAYHGRVDAAPTTFGGMLTEPLVLVSVKDVTRYKDAENRLRADRDEALREEAMLSAVLESLHVAVVIADRDGRFLRANRAYRLLAGADISPAAIDEYDVFEGYDPESGRRLANEEWPLAQAVTSGKVTVGRRIDVRRGGDGELRHLSFSATPIGPDEGEVLGGVTVAEDVTELLRAEETARASEMRLRLMVDGARDHAFCMLERDGRIATWSAGGERLTLYVADDVIGRPWSMLFYPDEVAAGLPERLLRCAVDEGVAHFRGWRRRGDGSRFWADIVISAVFDRDALVGFAEVARDMTAERASQAELRLRAEAMRTVSQGILVVDVRSADQPIILVSGGFTPLTGYAAADVLGRNCALLQGPGTDAATVAEMGEAIRTGREHSVEILNFRKDGSSFWNEVYLSPIRDDEGQVEKFVAVMADVTERRSLEDRLRQSQKMDALGRMAGGIAHDFNNILTIVNGNAEELIELLGTDHPGREQLDLIVQAGVRAELLTNQLLTFSRRSTMQPHGVALGLVVEHMHRLLDSLVGDSVVLDVRIDAGLWPVWADRSQMEQVLLNLVINARDAMPDGGTVTIALANVPAADAAGVDEVHLKVGDTGHGMDPQTRARALEPFFSTKGSNGNGLGLATVFGVVSQSGGTLALHSAPGEGTSVEVRLPRSSVAAVAPLPPPATGEHPGRRAGVTVLVAEDEAEVRRLIRRSLERRGFQVLEARNGMEALSVARHHPGPIDLLITDVMMPAMNGVALAEALRLKQPDLRVLFATGYAEEGLGARLEARHVIRKPFTARTLDAAIGALLDTGG